MEEFFGSNLGAWFQLLPTFDYTYNGISYTAPGERGSWNSYVNAFLTVISGGSSDGATQCTETNIKNALQIIASSGLDNAGKQAWTSAITNYANDEAGIDISKWIQGIINVPGNLIGSTLSQTLKPILIGIGIVGVLIIGIVYFTGKQGISYRGVKLGGKQ